MATRAWFSTSIYSEPLQPFGVQRLNIALAEDCASIRAHDSAGRRWSARHYGGGFTSYASMSELHKMSSVFTALEKRLRVHVLRFARQLDMDLRGHTVFMTDCWINIMPKGASHSLHLHPLSFISGTYYVRTPAGCAGLKFEDPRLDRFMAAPPRRANARSNNLPFVTYPAVAGRVILFESWLRHEVTNNATEDGERISVSFNYNWS